MLDELQENYIPDNFLFRETEINRIRQIFSQFKNNNCSLNLAVIGGTGLGKTSIIKKIVQEMDNSIYVSLTEFPTVNKLFKYLSGEKNHATGDLVNAFISKMKKERKILIFDEVGKLDKKEAQTFSNIINTIHRNAGTPIIIITNKFTFIEEMPEDARLSLIFEKVYLKPYRDEELREILKDRMIKVKSNEKIVEFQENALGIIASIVYSKHLSSARVALRMLYKCILSDNFSQDFITKCSDEITDEDFSVFIHTLNRTEKEVLETILNLLQNNSQISVSSIANEIISTCPPGSTRISQIVTSLSESGIIKTTTINLGRSGGLTRTISIAKKEYTTKLLNILKPWEGVNLE